MIIIMIIIIMVIIILTIIITKSNNSITIVIIHLSSHLLKICNRQRKKPGAILMDSTSISPINRLLLYQLSLI